MGSSFGTNDFFIETEHDIDDGSYILNAEEGKTKSQAQRTVRSDSTHSKAALLDVPTLGQDSRRSSSMTCCSTESSYLERRCSAFTLGLSNFQGTLQRNTSTSSTDNWDYIYPDIQVINATPKPSPNATERSQNGQKFQTNTLIRKQSIAYCDPAKPQVGRCQQPHSISANIFDSYPKQQQQQQQRTTFGIQPGFHSFDIAAEEKQQQQQRRKISLIELQEDVGELTAAAIVGLPQRISTTITTNTAYENNNNHSFPCQKVAKTTAAGNAGAGNSSSISMDSTPLSIDQLNGSSSLDTVSVKALFNAEKRAPLASLSSFKISSIEYAESELQTPDEESVFLKNTGCDTDDDMQDISSDSEQVSYTGSHIKARADKNRLKQTDLLQKTPVLALLQRQRSISASSSDRVLLLGQQTSANLLQSAVATPTEMQVYRSPKHKQRAFLVQQYSDPKSLLTEEDTCSTLNTELCGNVDVGGSVGAGSSNTTLTQYSSLNTVLSFGKLSLTPENNHLEAQADRCASTLSDSICLPDALKNVILRGSTAQDKNESHSSTNLLETSEVRLELPLIKLSLGKSAENSTSSASNEKKSCDPSLPSSSRKWSKETLF